MILFALEEHTESSGGGVTAATGARLLQEPSFITRSVLKTSVKSFKDLTCK